MVGLSRARLTGGSGESGADAYFATAFLLTPRAEAIFLCEQPRTAIPLIHSCVDLGIVILPSSSSSVVWGNLRRGIY